MAFVKINIPGIGEVIAENAASEETLLKLLAAMEKTGKDRSKKDPTAAAAEESKKKEAKASGDVTTSKKSEADATRKTTKQTVDSASVLKKTWAQMTPGLGQVTGALTTLATSTAKTAISMAAQFATMYDEMAKNPIAAASGVMATKIDMMGNAATATVDVFTGVVGAAAPLLNMALPGLGTGVSMVTDALGGLAKEAVKLSVDLFKAANEVMAKEFQKSVDALKDYTKAGASFAGGMEEMRRTATDAGLTMEDLGAAAKMAREDINIMGLSQAEGAKKLATGMGATAKVIGKSGNSLRDEMLALGYSYEEQGGVMASYMAQQKASGNLERMSTEQIARGTAEYAKNLKVISDITGQDAKKLMEKARAETQRSSLISSLDAKQQAAYKNAFTALETFGPDADKARQALFQVLKTGTTNVIGYTSGPAKKMIDDMAKNVKSGSLEFKDAMGIVDTNAKDFALQNKNSTGAMADFVRGMGVNSTAIDGYAQTSNAFMSVANRSVGEMAEGSSEAATKQSESTDQQTKAYQNLTAVANATAVEMQKLAGSNMGSYATILATTYTQATDAFRAGIRVMQQLAEGKTMKEIALSGVKDQLAAAEKQNAINLQAMNTAQKTMNFLKSGAMDVVRTVQKYSVPNALFELAKLSGVADSNYFEEMTGGLLDTMRVGMIKGETETLRNQGKIPKLANGGIVSGPTTGFDAILHGNEAVVPLSGGRAIPVDISGLADVIKSISGTAGSVAGKMPNIDAVVDSSAKIISASMAQFKMPELKMPNFNASDIGDKAREMTGSMNETLVKMSEVFAKSEESKSKVPAAVAASNVKSESLLNEVKDLLSNQLSKQDAMIAKLSESVDINQRLLTQAYS